MPVTHGADTSQLRERARAILRHAQAIGDLEARSTRVVKGLSKSWQGADSDAFARRWAKTRSDLSDLEASLSTLAATVTAQADDQDKVSGLTVGVGAAAAGAPATPSRLDETLAGMSEAERLDYLTSDEFAAARTADPDGTKAALDRAFDTGLLPSAALLGFYRDFMRRYWTTDAMKKAGINPESWKPADGYTANEDTVRRVYEYYGQLYLNDPDLQWAAMANIIGPSFAGGFADLAMAREVANGLRDLPLPPNQKSLINSLGGMSAPELRFYENSLLEMQKEIFLDQAFMHQAYVEGGPAELSRLRDAGMIDSASATAWEDIASGDPTRVQAGNLELLRREQRDIIQDNYERMRNHGATGEAVTYGMTLMGEPSIPGAQAFGEVFPVSVTTGTPGPERIPLTPFDNPLQGSVKVTTPFPNGNIADEDSRWELITKDTLPAFQAMSEDEKRAQVESDFAERLHANRPTRTADDFALRMARGVDIDADQ